MTPRFAPSASSGQSSRASAAAVSSNRCARGSSWTRDAGMSSSRPSKSAIRPFAARSAAGCSLRRAASSPASRATSHAATGPSASTRASARWLSASSRRNSVSAASARSRCAIARSYSDAHSAATPRHSSACGPSALALGRAVAARRIETGDRRGRQPQVAVAARARARGERQARGRRRELGVLPHHDAVEQALALAGVEAVAPMRARQIGGQRAVPARHRVPLGLAGVALARRTRRPRGDGSRPAHAVAPARAGARRTGCGSGTSRRRPRSRSR